MSATPRTPIALTIAGSDPSGGAGLQADLKTFSALGVYGASIVTALTAQNTRGVTGVFPVPAAFIARQAEALALDLSICAVKTGMLGDAATVGTVAGILMVHDFGPLVVDPVMVATSGDVLLAPEAITALREKLVPLAALITPNLHEAAMLLDVPVATSLDDMKDQGRRLLELNAGAVLVKGGHQTGDLSIDVLVTPTDVIELAAPRINTPNTHGTGCTLSSAIAAHLAEGAALADAVRGAKAYLSAALLAGRDLHIGGGHGPVDHLYAVRRHRP